MDGSVDPYKVLNIPKNFTIEQLKEAYKKMALTVHPDKGGSEYLFKLVTLCYKALTKDYNKRNSDKQYQELKSSFLKSQQTNKPTNVEIDPSRGGFNIKKFNKIFEENKIEDITDTGYGNFLKDTPDVKQKKLFNCKNFSNEAFNKQFEKRTTQDDTNKFVVKYRDPEPLMASKKIAYTELGQESIDDFSSENISKKSLNFMDLKIAHTTSRIVDPRNVNQRKEYKTIDDVEKDRSQISYNMDDHDREYYEKMKKLDDLKEKKRVEVLQNKDAITAAQFDKLHKLMLGR